MVRKLLTSGPDLRSVTLVRVKLNRTVSFASLLPIRVKEGFDIEVRELFRLSEVMESFKIRLPLSKL